MESLFLVLGIIGGLIAGFAITYFAFVGKLQKKLASAKKKLDRAQSANEEADTLQSQLDAQKSERQAAESQLAALEAAHQAQIRDLEAELESLRQSSVSLEQIPPDHSEELAALQNRLAEVEQNHQETLQSRLAEVEHQHQEAVQALQARHQDELESLRQSLTVAPPFPTPETATERITEETESLATEPTPGNWGTAAIAGGAAAIGAGIAALSNFGESLSPETTDAISEEGDRELAVEPLELPEVVAVVESETPDFPELTEEFSSTEDSQPSPFEQTDVFDTDSFAAPPGAEAEDLSPFAPPEAPVTDENWVDMPDSLVSSEEIMAGRDIFDEEEVLPPLAIDTPVAFGSTVPLGIETDNWVDIPDNVERIDNEFETSEFETGEPPAALLPDFSETAETGLLDVDNLLADGGETGTFTAELPDMEEGEDVGLGLELPDMTEEPDLGEFSFEDQTLEELGDDGPDGDALLAALTGTGQEEPSLGFFALEETTAENEVIEEDLSLLSNAGDTLEMPDSFLADIPSFIPDADSDTEDMAEVGTDGDDDLDFLLQLQDDEPPSSPGEEFLPEFNDDDPLSVGFPTMELLADDNSEISDLLGEGRLAHEGDPFVNILDENPPASDNDLLALLQDEDGSGIHHHESDDDLFSGLEGMLNTDTPDDESDLNDLDALLNSSGELGKAHDEVFSLEDLGLGEDKY